MLEEERIRLFDEFIPKEGFKLKSMLCCTYGVDPTLIITLLLYSMGEVDQAFMSGEIDAAGKEKLRECIWENRDKLIVLTSKEAPKMSKDIGTAQLLITKNICTVKEGGEKQGTFHPKMILGIYENLNGEIYSKCYIGSKNLTVSNSYEFGIVVDLVKGGNSVDHILTTLSVEPHIKLRFKKSIEKIRSTLKAKSLGLPKEIKLLIQSRADKSDKFIDFVKSEFKDSKDIFIHSPWISRTILKEILNANKKSRVFVKCLPIQKNVKELSGLDGVSFIPDSSLKSNGAFHEGNSHMKVSYHKKSQREAGVLFGSANYTNRGLGIAQKNTELLVNFKPQSGKQYDFLRLDQYDVVDEVKTEEAESLNEEALRSIINLNIDLVRYIKVDNEIEYDVAHPSGHTVIIKHYLIEEFNGNDSIELIIKSGQKGRIKKKCDYPLHLFSSYVKVFLKEDRNISFDMTVELDDVFYNALSSISDVNYFKLKAKDYLKALYDLLGLSFDVDNSFKLAGQDGVGSHSKYYDFLLENYPLDKLAIKLSQKRKNDKKGFDRLKKRIEALCEDIERDPTQISQHFLKELKVVIN